jgi:glycosyltransferase involved in cell wall biosynthesis
LLSIIYISFAVVVLIQVFYYGYLFSHFSFANKQQPTLKAVPVSVVIACRNEVENLKKNLPNIIDQQYPVFEIILVDDASDDATHSIMQKFSTQYDFIKVVRIPKKTSYNGNKKNALTRGIQKASYKYLIFTDADCIPNSKNWLKKTAYRFSETKQIVLGYSPYKKYRGLFNKLVRYETLLTAWQYFAYALIKIPYMGVGRNMGYTKTLFEKAGGFQSHNDIKSGDDDLFVSQMATFNNVAICWDNEAFVYSEPKKNLNKWLQQKRRHITTATRYSLLHQLLLGFFYLSQILFFGLFFILLFSGFKVKQLLILVLIRYFFYYINLIPTANKLGEKDLLPLAPFLELYLIVIQLRIFIANLWHKPKEW